MQQFGAFHVLQLSQDAHDFSHVVSIKRSEVPDVHAFEDVLLVADGRLDGVVEPQDTFLSVLTKVAAMMEPLRSLEPQLVVSGIRIEGQEIFFHATHCVVDAHVVVVEDDEKVVRSRRNVVQSLECQSTTHGTIADNGYNLLVILATFLGCDGHTQCRRDGIGGMSTGESVVLALQRRGKWAQSMQFSVGGKLLPPPGEYLVSIGLVAHIPYKFVAWRVKHIVQGHGNLNGSQRRRKVSGVYGDLLDDVFAKFTTHLWQLFNAEFS